MRQNFTGRNGGRQVPADLQRRFSAAGAQPPAGGVRGGPLSKGRREQGPTVRARLIASAMVQGTNRYCVVVFSSFLIRASSVGLYATDPTAMERLA